MLGKNIAANAIARLWIAGLQLIITPLLVHLLGPTSYGLVGFYASLFLFLAFLDQLISPVLSRELATLKGDSTRNGEARDLLRTMELISGAMALFVGTLLVASSSFVAQNWLNRSGLPQDQLITSIRLMGIAIAAQWPMFLYGGGFTGLQRQDVLALIRVVGGTIQAVGAVLLLAYVSATPQMFLAWQAGTSILISAVLGISLWRIMPPTAGASKFNWAILKRLWRFAAGTLSIGLLGVILTQSGALITAKYFTLDQLASYTLSMNLAIQVSTILTQPISATLMPHFAQLLKHNDSLRVASEYHRWTQIMVALVLPAAATLIFFPLPVLKLWLGSTSPLAHPVSQLLPWMVAGSMFNTFVTPPFFLQIASGWTRLSVLKNVIAVFIFIPVLLLTVPRYGPHAAAVAWLMLNVGYYLFEVPIMHRYLLQGELRKWWFNDTLLPTGATAAVYATMIWLLPATDNIWLGLLQAAAAAVITALALLLVLPFVRGDAKIIWRYLLDWRLSKS